MNQIFKVILLGETNCGKSSFLDRIIFNAKTRSDDEIINQYVLPTSSSTIGSCFASIELDDIRRLHIWDTAGQERFRSLMNLYSRGSDAIIVVFDVNNPYTFNQAKDYWIPYIKSNFEYHTIQNDSIKNSENVCRCAPIVILLGNKVDVLKSSEENFRKFVTSFMKEIKKDDDSAFIDNIMYFPISVKTGYNINNVFKYIIESLRMRDLDSCPYTISQNPKEEKNTISLDKSSQKKCFGGCLKSV